MYSPEPPMHGLWAILGVQNNVLRRSWQMTAMLEGIHFNIKSWFVDTREVPLHTVFFCSCLLKLASKEVAFYTHWNVALCALHLFNNYMEAYESNEHVHNARVHRHTHTLIHKKQTIKRVTGIGTVCPWSRFKLVIHIQSTTTTKKKLSLSSES